MTTSTAWGGYANGQIPLNAMVVVRGERFEPEAGAQLERLESAFTARFGTPAIILEGYRSLARQQYLWQQWTSGVTGANRAAFPGTSNHGYGRAVDFASRIDLFDSAEHKWMVANAPTYGWHWGEAPTEAWHFTYYPGTATASSGATPIPATTTPTAGRKKEDTMNFVYVDEKVVDVPGKAGVRNATYKTQRTWVQYGESFYKEFTASQETANGYAAQAGGNAIAVNREFLNSIQASQADARNKLAAAIAAALKK